MAEFHDSNIFATETNRTSDFVSVIAPHLIAES